jgi:type IV secretion system protein VirB8
VRIAWRVAAGAAAIALLLALALVLLVPLKSVQPYVLTVDRNTGAVEAANTLQNGRLSQNEAVIQAQLAGYVIARETFDATDLAQQYRRVQIMSAPPVARAYVSQMAANNPESPLRTLNRGDTVSIKIRSVSLIADGAGIVRFTATRTPAGSATGEPSNYVAALSFGFNGRPLRAADRYDNPLGFQVTRYRRDAEGFVG